jgi:hypothetical protein
MFVVHDMHAVCAVWCAVGRSDVQFDVCGSVCGACGLVWNVVVL